MYDINRNANQIQIRSRQILQKPQTQLFWISILCLTFNTYIFEFEYLVSVNNSLKWNQSGVFRWSKSLLTSFVEIQRKTKQKRMKENFTILYLYRMNCIKMFQYFIILFKNVAAQHLWKLFYWIYSMRFSSGYFQRQMCCNIEYSL